MFLFCLGIVLFVLLLAGTLIANAELAKAPNNDKPKISIAYALLPLILSIIPLFYSVSTGEVGVKTAFGKVTGQVQAGVGVKAPWEKINKINVRVNKLVVEEMSASTKDLQVIDHVNVAFNYQVNLDKAQDLYSTVGMDFEQIVIQPAVQQSVKSQISKYNAEELATARAQVASDVADELNNKLNGYGINILSAAIDNYDYSAEYNAAIEAKAVAAQEVQAAQQRLEKAKIDAETKLVAAQADAEANRLLQSTLSELVVREKMIEKWNGELPKAVGTSGLIMSDLLK